MHHFKYNIEKKEILLKRQAYIDEISMLKNDLEKLTNRQINEFSLIQKLKEANEFKMNWQLITTPIIRNKNHRNG